MGSCEGDGETKRSESVRFGRAGAGSFAVGNMVSESSSSEDEARIWESPSGSEYGASVCQFGLFRIETN